MTAARLGLVVVAVAQLAVCVPVLLFGHDRSAPLHVAHEMGSFEVAIAIGFLVAARRPGRAMGMLSLMGAAAGLLVVTATLDLVAGRTDLSDEAPHLHRRGRLAAAGWRPRVAPPTWERPRSHWRRHRRLVGPPGRELTRSSATEPRSRPRRRRPTRLEGPAVPDWRPTGGARRVSGSR